MAILSSVNIGRPQPTPNPSVHAAPLSGIGKRPVAGAVQVRAPGPKGTGLGGGLVGDFIGDGRHHGGDDQAVYAVPREDLDVWEERLGRPLPNGFFGENLTTRGLEVNEARIGERWRVGEEVVLQVTVPRIPCNTFRHWVDEARWVRTFTEAARPGAYLRVIVPGFIAAGDPIEVIRRPDHDVTIALVFRAITRERDLLPRLLAAGEDLEPELAEMARKRELAVLDS